MTNSLTRPLGVTRARNTVFEWGKRTYVMGILNVTPDSFSGDGLGANLDAAVAQARRFEAEGADILDLGGESTRPGHTPVSEAEELARVLPALEAIRPAVSIPISIDSFKVAVARAALDRGADIINDQWALQRDPALGALAAERGVPIILMHNQTGARYHDLIGDMIASLRRSCEAAQQAGVPWENIIVDPGIGFGKTPEQSIEALRRLDELKALGRPILLGPSHKRFIAHVLELPVEQRLEGTAAAIAIGIMRGADIIRVHDVQAMARVARMTDALVR